MSKSRPGAGRKVNKSKNPASTLGIPIHDDITKESGSALDIVSSTITTASASFRLDPTSATPSPAPSASSTLVVKQEGDLKIEAEETKFIVTEMPPDDFDVKDGSPTPTLPPATPTLTTAPSSTKKQLPTAPQLIGHLPVAREEALRLFTEIPTNQYQYMTLGRSREVLESMTCDCSYEHGVDDLNDACSYKSDCINRLTQVECLPDDCRCRTFCQNQRFQKREYADIDIVQTEKKGFGLRAEKDLLKDTFIYEYVGEVVSNASFLKRMRDYAAEGIRHFYFMMLQKDEFIDATKRGGIGRFANHSCSPNCYVAKWTIGQHVRMGIFASRDIKKDEELTFNYNVDRYGHEAQPCYCGEPKCVGYIGGKTQTDIATMDDLYLDALGITDEADRLELKGSKKKKGKKIDDPDFMPILKPIIEKDVPKVIQAMRQTLSRKVLFKLLTRIRISEDQGALRQIMRLRGFSLMTNILNDYVGDTELVALAMQCMSGWPLLARNKVDDSKVNIPVEAFTKSEDETVKTLAQKLLDQWSELPSAYRIPKRMKQAEDEDTSIQMYGDDSEMPPSKRSRNEENLQYEEVLPGIKPLGYKSAVLFPRRENPPAESASEETKIASLQRKSVAAIIAAASAEAAAVAEATAAAATAAAETQKVAPVAEDTGIKKKHRSHKKHQTPEEREQNKEKRLLKLVGQVVVKCMSKHSKAMDHDLFKKHAKELTQLIADKEKKSTSYKEGKLDSLSDEKIVKIKKFAKEYIAKVLRKLEKSGRGQKRQSSSSNAVTSTSMTHSPNSAEGAEVVMAEMTVEEAMDLDSDSQSEDEAMEGETSTVSVQGALLPSLSRDGLATPTFDPRRRPPSEDREFGWEPHKPGRQVGSVSLGS